MNVLKRAWMPLLIVVVIAIAGRHCANYPPDNASVWDG